MTFFLFSLLFSGCSATNYITGMFAPSEPTRYAEGTGHAKPIKLEDIKYYEVVIIDDGKEVAR